MRVNFIHKMTPLAAVLVIGAFAACSSDLTGGNRQPVKISFTTKASSPAAGVAMDVVVGPASDLVITSAQFVVSKVELDRTGTTNCVAEIEATGDDHASVGSECEDVERDPIVVDVPVDGALHGVLTVPLAEGTYNQLEAKLEPARAEATAFNAANTNLVGKSVRVVGTYKNVSFTFTSSVRAELEMEFNPPLVVDATTNNTTISFDVGKWFLDANNAVIDPNTTDAAQLQTIDDNIKRSFHAFEDQHETGEDTHQGHGG